MRFRAFGALLAVLTAGGAAAAPFHVPVHLPPRIIQAAAEGGPSASFGAGYAHAGAGGMSLSGPGGFAGLDWRLEDGLSGSLRGGGFLLSGESDPFGAGRRMTNGGAALLEADLIWAPEDRAAYRLYAGLQGHVTVLDVRDAAAVPLTGAPARVEPDTAVTHLLGIPLGGLLSVPLGGSWSMEWQADVTLHPAGSTFFTYGPGGAPASESTRRLDFTAAAGTGVRLSRAPARLSLEALLRRSFGFGNNEPAVMGALLLTMRGL